MRRSRSPIIDFLVGVPVISRLLQLVASKRRGFFAASLLGISIAFGLIGTGDVDATKRIFY